MGKKRIHTDSRGNEFTLEDEVFVLHVKRPSHVGKQEMRDYVGTAIEQWRKGGDPQDAIMEAKFTVRKPPLQGDRAK